MKSTDIGKQHCVSCGYKMDQTTQADGDGVPSPGDFSMCLNCGHVAVFDADLCLREPTPEEKVAIAEHAVLLRAQITRASVVNRSLIPEGLEDL